MQAIDAHKRAGSLFWMLLCRRDGRVSMVYMNCNVQMIPRVLYDIPLCNGRRLRFMGVKLADFLSQVSPKYIVNLLE
jgi:hypothetical protein